MNNLDDTLRLIGEKIEGHRRKNKLTTNQVALKCEIKPSLYVRIEKGLEEVPLSKLIDIAYVLNFDFKELFLDDYHNQNRIIKLIASVKKLENISDDDLKLTTHLIDLLLLKYSVKNITEQMHTYHK